MYLGRKPETRPRKLQRLRLKPQRTIEYPAHQERRQMFRQLVRR